MSVSKRLNWQQYWVLDFFFLLFICLKDPIIHPLFRHFKISVLVSSRTKIDFYRMIDHSVNLGLGKTAFLALMSFTSTLVAFWRRTQVWCHQTTKGISEVSFRRHKKPVSSFLGLPTCFLINRARKRDQRSTFFISGEFINSLQTNIVSRKH